MWRRAVVAQVGGTSIASALRPPFGLLGHPRSNLRVATLSRVLVAQGGLWRGPSDPRHQLGQGGAGLSGEGGARVAQVVHTRVFAIGGLAPLGPMAGQSLPMQLDFGITD